MGGEYTPDNIKMVTLEEHIKEHEILYKKYGKQEDLIAVRCMKGQISGEEANILATKAANNGNTYRKGKTQTGDMRRFGHWTGKKLSKEHREKIAKAGIGKKQTKKQKEAVTKANSKEWIITYPDGKTEKVFNLNAFCREHNLDQSNLCRGSHRKYLAQRA